MSIFSKLLATCAAINDKGDDYITPPATELTIKYVPIPVGPGRAQLAEVLKLLPKPSLDFGPWIAGGAARRLLQGKTFEEGDVDFFFANFSDWQKYVDCMDEKDIVAKTKQANTYCVNGIKIQLIKRKFYKSLDKVFSDFDFSACQVATDGLEIASSEQAYDDVMNNILRFAPKGVIAKHTLVQRMAKYVGHGFIPESGMFKMIVESGLDYVSAWAIFEGSEAAIYDANDGTTEQVNTTMLVEDLNAGVLRTVARNLGLEITND